MDRPTLSPVQHLKGVVVFCLIAPPLLLLNVAQTMSLAILPFSRKAFRAFNRWAADSWWGLCVDVARTINGTGVEVVGDDVPDRENAIVIVNHQSMADIVVLFFLARAKASLGDMKWFVKDPLKYVPGVGWGMLFLGCLFVKREWTRDRAGIEATFATVIDEEIPVWVITFSEGTRRTEAKHAASMRYAEERSLTPTTHVMIPRTKGFVATVKGLRSHCTAVYDVTIGYPGFVPTLWELMSGLSARFELDVRRHAMADLPTADDELSEWLMERFREKDERLGQFAPEGRFPRGASVCGEPIAG